MENLPEISQKALYIYHSNASAAESSIVINGRWERIGDHIFLVGTWPKDPPLVKSFAGKEVRIRFDSIESITEFESAEELYEMVYAGRSSSTSRSYLAQAMYYIGIAIVFGNYIGKVPADIAWIGWALGIVGWYLAQKK